MEFNGATTITTSRAIARALPPPGSDGKPPAWIELIPAGELIARDGRRWNHSAPASVLAASRAYAGNSDLVIDYEHQTERVAKNGRPAPAAGWIRALDVRRGALWGLVEWTKRATAAIVAREYRYISPTFRHTPAPASRVLYLERAALTNSPALEMQALARAIPSPEQLRSSLAMKKITQVVYNVHEYINAFVEKIQGLDRELNRLRQRTDNRGGLFDEKDYAEVEAKFRQKMEERKKTAHDFARLISTEQAAASVAVAGGHPLPDGAANDLAIARAVASRIELDSAGRLNIASVLMEEITTRLTHRTGNIPQADRDPLAFAAASTAASADLSPDERHVW